MPFSVLVQGSCPSPITRVSKTFAPHHRVAFPLSYCIVIDQTSCQNNIFLPLCQFSQMQGKGNHPSVFDRKGLHFLASGFDFLTNPRKEDKIQIREGQRFLFDQERKHPPIHEVAAIPFCCIFSGNVCPATQYLLTGRRLLSRTAVSRLSAKIVEPNPTFSLLTFGYCP